MHKFHNPSTASKPGPTYSQGVETAAGARTLHVSGQIGVDAAGRTGETAAEQSRMAFANVEAILHSAGMNVTDLVRIRCYLVDDGDLGAFKVEREAFLKGAKPASSLIIVKALADPKWLVEVEADAAK